ncbi:hypothetical protein L484_007061 [Morus notabilis]|uniref:Uncharacterized protein n=1 Tax=Morus notabilis TaxID=981085 RepID=W9RTI3_9ROSA|nr:hypothetical protein L484_007061 [Morus notabilis]
MAGIAIVLDLLRKNPSFYTSHAVHSCGFFSAPAAAASLAAGIPFAYKALFGIPVAHCDAGTTWSEEYVSSLRSASERIFQNDAIKYSAKEYKIELKPLFSAFELRTFAMTTLRSFLLFYLPLLEPRSNLEEDDDDFLQDTNEEQHTTVVTSRRILERMAVHYISQRMAWKLLKGHFLGVAASWIVQVSIEIYRFFRRMLHSKEEDDEVETTEQVKNLGKKISATTVRCSASLIFASIGAGIGATLFRPSVGQWIGSAVGDLAGPIIVSSCVQRVFHLEI